MLYSLDQIVNKPVLFSMATQQRFSETSFLIKFWCSVIVELFFDPISTIFNSKLQAKSMYIYRSHLCRGNTTSLHLSVSNLYFNLDFRVIVEDINTEELDVVTGEVARQASITPSKVYYNFLKSTLTTKAYLNAALKRIPYITPIKIKNAIVPMIQIMGLSCAVYGMNVIDKKV